MSTIKVSELATKILTSSNYFIHSEGSVAYKSDLASLSNFINTVGSIGFRGDLSASDTPTLDGWYLASESATYINAGGLVVDLSNGMSIIISESTQTVFSQVVIPLTQPTTSKVESSNTTIAVNGKGVYDSVINKADLIPKANIFNIGTVSFGVRTTNNGIQSPNASFDSSDFIKVKPNTNYTSFNAAFYSAYYDINKDLVAGGLPGGNVSTWLTPANAEYVIICTLTTQTTNYTLVEGLVTPPISAYELVVEKEQINTISALQEGNEELPLNSKAVKDYHDLNVTKINPYFRVKTNLVSQSTDDETHVFESSIFSAWGCGVGVRSSFEAVKLFINSWDSGNPISNIKCRIRENDYNGTILAEKQLSINDVYEDESILFDFDTTINSVSPLWVEYLTDGGVGYVGTVGDLDVGQGSTTMRYLTNKSLTAEITTAVSTSPQRVINTSFVTVNDLEIELTTAGKTRLRSELQVPQIPRLILPDTIYAVVGYKQQLFFRGMIEGINPYEWNIKITGNVGGKQFPRYYEFTPSSAGTKTFTISLYDTYNNLLATNSCTVNIVAAKTTLTTTKVLSTGDSLTDADVWTEEFRRMIVESGGTPVGLGLSNFTPIGTQGVAPNLNEGYGGKNWAFFIGNTSPFWNSGTSQLDFANYVSVNGFGTIDYNYILLTWNGIANILDPKKNAADHADLIADAKVYIDQLHSDFPSCKVRLMGIQLPSLNGGLGENYGDANATLGNYYNLVQTVNGLNLAYQELANDVSYSSFVEFVNVSTQFDNENNMPTVDEPVNTRNATTEKRGANGVHPDTSGYLQIADVAFRSFNAS